MARLQLGPGAPSVIYLPGAVVPATPPAGALRLVVIGVAAPDTAAPSAPTGLSAVAGNAQVQYAWTASTDNVAVTKYRVRRAGTVVAEPTATAYTLTGLTNGTAVADVSVSAADAAGNESAQVAFPSATPAANSDTTAPSAPTGLAAAPGNGSAALSWTASTDNVAVTGYRVRRGATVLATPTGTSATLTGLTNGAAYTDLTLAAYDAAGNESAQVPFPAVVPQATAGTQYATGFTTDATGALPASWSSIWDARTVTVVDDTALAGNRVLQLASTAAAQRTGVVWTTVPNAADVEVLARVRLNGSTSDASLLARASGTGTSENGILGREVSTTSDVIFYTNATSNTAAALTANILPKTNVWGWQRLQVVGTAVRYKAWLDGAAEPAAWSIDTTVTNTAVQSAGASGVFRFNAGGTTEFDYVGVGVGVGVPAPAPAA